MLKVNLDFVEFSCSPNFSCLGNSIIEYILHCVLLPSMRCVLLLWDRVSLCYPSLYFYIWWLSWWLCLPHCETWCIDIIFKMNDGLGNFWCITVDFSSNFSWLTSWMTLAVCSASLRGIIFSINSHMIHLLWGLMKSPQVQWNASPK